jgi:hypothetical protein
MEFVRRSPAVGHGVCRTCRDEGDSCNVVGECCITGGRCWDSPADSTSVKVCAPACSGSGDPCNSVSDCCDPPGDELSVGCAAGPQAYSTCNWSPQ